MYLKSINLLFINLRLMDSYNDSNLKGRQMLMTSVIMRLNTILNLNQNCSRSNGQSARTVGQNEIAQKESTTSLKMQKYREYAIIHSKVFFILSSCNK